MGQLLSNTLFWGVLVFGGSIAVIFCFILGIRKDKRDNKKQKGDTLNKEHKPMEAEYTPVEIRATVIEQTCCVKTIGYKTPKTIKEFMIVFQTENGKILKLKVPEEMYDGFEQGQTGILSMIDGELYGFELEEEVGFIS